ncbi:MAG: hypothetical protein RLZZ321_176 [Bacteroidota bacterium]|jgi:hypothetical protein
MKQVILLGILFGILLAISSCFFMRILFYLTFYLFLIEFIIIVFIVRSINLNFNKPTKTKTLIGKFCILLIAIFVHFAITRNCIY